jgi:hypothetical protein
MVARDPELGIDDCNHNESLKSWLYFDLEVEFHGRHRQRRRRRKRGEGRAQGLGAVGRECRNNQLLW